MKRISKTVWLDAKGSEVLEKRDNGKYYTSLGTMDEETMRELGEAIADALKPELPQAPQWSQANP